MTLQTTESWFSITLIFINSYIFYRLRSIPFSVKDVRPPISKIAFKIKSFIISLYYAKACNEFVGPSPRHYAFRKNVAASVSCLLGIL